MSTRWADWLRQAHADLALARHALAGAHHEWACFAARLAAEPGMVKTALEEGVRLAGR